MAATSIGGFGKANHFRCLTTHGAGKTFVPAESSHMPGQPRVQSRAHKPDVSFVTPVGRPEAFLAEAGESIRRFAQLSGARVEWVIACDGVTPAEISDYVGVSDRSTRIVVLDSPAGPRTGPARTRNRALAVASAPILGALDSDDILIPEGMAFLYRRITTTKAMWVAGGMVIIDVEGHRKLDGTPIHLSERVRTPRNVLINYFEKHGHFPWHSTGTFARTDIIRAVGGWDESVTFARAEDFAMWARVTKSHQGLWSNLPVVAYRENPDSITHTEQWDRFENIAYLLRTRLDSAEPSTGTFDEDLRRNWDQSAQTCLLAAAAA